MKYKLTTQYDKEFVQWLNSESEAQKLGLSDVFNWQWFITLTSKDTMTKNGARLAMTRFLGLYLKESKTDEVTCLWVAEPHNQGKKGYHVHALLQTRWPVPQSKERAHNVALMLDDIYQRAMGLSPWQMDKSTMYLDKFGNITNKHRFRADVYSKARGEYCVKYITKADEVLWEFARVTSDEIAVTGQEFYGSIDDDSLKDCKGNWEKKSARLQTKALKKANELRKGEKLIYLNQLRNQAELNWAKFSKLRASKNQLITEHVFQAKPGVLVF